MNIRIVSPADVRQLLAIYEPYVLHTSVSFETEVPSEAEMLRRIHASLKNHAWLVVEAQGKVLGYAYSSRHRERPAYQWAADVSIYLAEAVHGKGIGSRLYRALLEIVRMQGFYKCYAAIALPNEKSQRLHESLGFLFLGKYSQVGYKHGRWHDVGWWEKNLKQPEQQPGQTKSLAELEWKEIERVLSQ